MTDLRQAAQQALEALEDARTFTGAWPTGVSAITALRAALAQQAEPAQEPAFHGFMSDDGTQVDVCFSPSAPRRDGTYATAYYTAPPQRPTEPAQGPEGMVEFLADLQRSRTKYPKNRRMFDGLMGEIDELRRAYAGDGDIRAEAFDVAVCAFRIATEGDAGGNARLEQAEPVQEPVAWLAPRIVDSYSRPDLGYETCSKSDYGAFPAYTAPPQRKPLKEEEIDAEWRELDGEVSTMFMRVLRKFARAIERAHGIKE